MEDAKISFARTVRALESGEIRVARKVNGTWVVDTAVKEREKAIRDLGDMGGGHRRPGGHPCRLQGG